MMFAEEDAFEAERLGLLPEIEIGSKVGRRRFRPGILRGVGEGGKELEDPGLYHRSPNMKGRSFPEANPLVVAPGCALPALFWFG